MRPPALTGRLAVLGALVLAGLLVAAAVWSYGDAPRTGLAYSEAAAGSRTAPSPGTTPPGIATTTIAGCDALSARIRGDASQLALIADGTLSTADLGTCRQRTLLNHASGPVQVSADGRFVASGAAVVSDRAGGQVQRPLGTGILSGTALPSWSWSPRGEGIAGLTGAGAVILGRPGRSPRTLEPASWHATSLLYAAGDELLVVRHFDAIWTVPLNGAPARELFRDPRRGPVMQLATVTDGWVVLWTQPYLSASTMADGDALIRVNLRTGAERPVAPSVLVAEGYVVPCGRGLAVLEGSGRDATGGKRIVLFDARWRPRPIGVGVSPSCSADGATIAYASGRREPEETFGAERRVIEIVHPGRPGTLTLGSRPSNGPGADDPILSPDGAVVEWIQADPQLPDPDTSEIDGTLHAGTTSRPVHVTGPLLRLGPTTDYYGTLAWQTTVTPLASVLARP